MKASDTIIKDFSLFWVDAEFRDTPKGVMCDEKYDLNKLLQAQAKISFNEGIKEVVNYVNKHLHDSPSCSYKKCFSDRVWQSKLKEWEM